MPDPNIGQLAATLFEQTSGKPTDNIFLSQLGLKILKDHDGFEDMSSEGGSVIEETLEYAENTTARSYGEQDLLDTTKVDTFDAARFEWKTLAATLTFTQQEIKRATGKNAKIKLAASRVQNTKSSMMADWNRQFYGAGTGNGGKDLGGIGLLVPADPTTGSVGGINRASFPFWRSRQTLGTKTTNAYDNLRSAMELIYNTCSKGAYEEHPEWFVFNQTDFQGYAKTLTANERFVDKKSADGGWNNKVFAFKGAKVTFDEDLSSAGTAYCLNGRNLKLKYLAWMEVLKDVEPANALSKVTRIWTYGNLCTNNSRRLGTITVIT
jgi:hypothetical protein